MQLDMREAGWRTNTGQVRMCGTLSGRLTVQKGGSLAVAQPTLETGRANGVARVVVVIVNYRTPELTGRCLASLEPEKRHLTNLQVLVVDGGSGDGSAERLGPVIKASRYRDWVSFMPLEI